MKLEDVIAIGIVILIGTAPLTFFGIGGYFRTLPFRARRMRSATRVRTVAGGGANQAHEYPIIEVVRVLVTLKEKGQDRATIDRNTSSVAEALRRAGAYVADPISGQPLVVAEIDRDRLPLVAQHPQVACIAADVPERTQ